jgi:hypothetical protein
MQNSLSHRTWRMYIYVWTLMGSSSSSSRDCMLASSQYFAILFAEDGKLLSLLKWRKHTTLLRLTTPANEWQSAVAAGCIEIYHMNMIIRQMRLLLGKASIIISVRFPARNDANQRRSCCCTGCCCCCCVCVSAWREGKGFGQPRSRTYGVRAHVAMWPYWSNVRVTVAGGRRERGSEDPAGGRGSLQACVSVCSLDRSAIARRIDGPHTGPYRPAGTNSSVV